LPSRLRSSILLLSLSILAGDSHAQSSTPTAPSAGDQTKTWTNDNIGGVKGNVSVVGSSSSSHPIPARSQSSGVSIISPAEGTTFKPGDVIPVEVRAASAQTISAMMIGSPLGFGDHARQSPPWSFTLTVPTEDRGMGGGVPLIGKHPITAVEEPEIPVKLWSQWTQMIFNSGDDVELPLDISGTFPDGLALDVSESTYISYDSSDTQVATVSAFGMVKPAGPGKAFIGATYGSGERTIRLVIPVSCASPRTPALSAPPP
jgi:hypothetical protein